MVRVRFAPSPTGFLHVGGARTALFNYLFARKNAGKFLIRIEDTDPQRSRREYAEDILQSLRWLGMEWDEPPLYQSSRMKEYKKIVWELYEKGYLYPCFCDPEELEKKRLSSPGYRYPGTCRDIPRSEAEKRMQSEPFAFRFKVPWDKEISFFDLIRGKITVKGVEIEDFVVFRRDGTPTYNFSVVVDDIFMGVTHVIRGEDHISNTPKQLLVYQALEAKPPQFAHLPIILGPDRKKLSKRHGDLSIKTLKERGFIPEAIFNYMALLGWSPGGDVQILSKNEIIERFSLERVSKNPAVFDIEKLLWMNGVYMRKLSFEQRMKYIVPVLERKGFDPYKFGREGLLKIIEITGDRLKKGEDILTYSDFFWQAPPEENVVNSWKEIEPLIEAQGREKILKALQQVVQRLENIPELSWRDSEIEREIRRVCEECSVKPKALIQAVRVLVTGKTVSPGIFESLSLMEKKEVLSRIKRGLSYVLVEMDESAD